MQAMEYFRTHLKYDKNPKSREMINSKARPALLNSPASSCPHLPWPQVPIAVGGLRLLLGTSVAAAPLRAGYSTAAVTLRPPAPTVPGPCCCALQFVEYLDRAEYIKGIMDGRQPAEEAPSSTANGAAAAKSKGSGGGGGGGDSKQVGGCCGLACCSISATLLRLIRVRIG